MRESILQQYETLKAKHPELILLFRMGDFYEMFHADAIAGAKILGLTLTSTNGGTVPLAGVPYHSVERYLSAMIKAGRKCAIIEQTEKAGE
jgi:DNA mismatch repair protein MutS